LKSTGFVRHWRTSGPPLQHRTFSSQPTPQAGEAVERGEALGYSARLGRFPVGLTGDDDAFALPLDGPHLPEAVVEEQLRAGGELAMNSC
jgi:hypothetical protein